MKGTVSLPGWSYFSIRWCNSARATSRLLLGLRPCRRAGDSHLVPSAHSSFGGDDIQRSALQYRPGWSSSGWCLTRVPPILELLSPNWSSGTFRKARAGPKSKVCSYFFPFCRFQCLIGYFAIEEPFIVEIARKLHHVASPVAWRCTWRRLQDDLRYSRKHFTSG